MIISKFEPVEVKQADGWFVRLLPTSWADTVQLWIGKTTPQGTYICYFDKSGRLNQKLIQQGSWDTKPTMEINRMIWEGLSRALQGVAQPPEQSHIEGELQELNITWRIYVNY